MSADAQQPSDMVRTWWALFSDPAASAFTAELCGLKARCAAADPGAAPLMALCAMGATCALIVAEPEQPVSTRKARHDWEDDEESVSIAPRWRWPLTREKTQTAILIPVGCSAQWFQARCLSFRDLGLERFAGAIVDLIALPLDGGRPLSMTGLTAALGAFPTDEKQRLPLFGSGKAWLDAHLKRARDMEKDMPAHLVARDLPLPDCFATLLLEPRALEWRVSRADCVVPHQAREIVCPDSRRLANWIDAAMKKRERARPLPAVLGPRQTERVA